jgi:hypothetical protein
MIGGRFGKLVVISQGEGYTTPKGMKQRQWNCMCDCGKTALVRTGHLTNQAVKSCGCGQGRYVHGMSYLTERGTWYNIKQRCCNPNHPKFALYGGRGITLCDRWKESFVAFMDDMGRRPFPKAEVDRIDNNGPYSPENCRWATRTEQCNNKRSNVFLEMDGVTRTRQEWSRLYGVDHNTIRARMRVGMTLKEALLTPIRNTRGKKKNDTSTLLDLVKGVK